MIIEREGEHDGLQEHHLVPGMALPDDEDEERRMDPDVLAAYDELRKVAKRKAKRRVH